MHVVTAVTSQSCQEGFSLVDSFSWIFDTLPKEFKMYLLNEIIKCLF